MNTMDDWQLLRDYANRNPEEAIIARGPLRRAGLSRGPAAGRQSAHGGGGDPGRVHRAGAKGGPIPRGTVLSGWLFRATRFAFNNLAREQIRRQRPNRRPLSWKPFFDRTRRHRFGNKSCRINDALDKLPRKDREAVLVRFFQDKSHRELARTLGVSEDAAKMRVSRALEKLRLIFARQGYAVPSAALLATISADGAQAVPAGMTASVASVAVAKGTVGTTSTLTLV